MKQKIFIALSAVALLLWCSAGLRAQPHGFDTPALHFDAEEQAWLDKHRVLKLGVADDAPPYEYLDKEDFKGISSSYVRIIEQLTGIRFELVSSSDWDGRYRLLESGQVDMLSAAVRNFGHPADFIYSRPYVASSLGIFGNNNTAFINNFDDVLEQKVAISETTLAQMPRFSKKEHNFIVYNDVAEALRAVNNGEIDFFVGDILHTKFSMDMYGLDNLRYVAPVVGSAYSFSMAVRPDRAMLMRIVNKVLSQISPVQHFEIRQRWTSDYSVREKMAVERYLQYLYLSFAAFALILLFLFYRSRLNKKKALQIAHTQKMESIGRLAGGVAHDFNNMLAGIHGAAEMLEMKIGSRRDLRKYTDIIINACERSSYLTSQLLVFSRDKGQKFSPMDMHACLHDAVTLLEHGVNKKIVIKEDFRASKHCISGNRNLIQSMILNLGFNAKDAMNGKGEIDISTRNVELREEDIADLVISVKPQRYLEVAVRDYGGGIPENIRHKIFEPFFTTKEIGKGTGLGLAAVYGIVLEHKGTIKIESSEKGTCFYLYFPVVANKTEKKAEHKEAGSLRAKVMVVDDEKILLELMKDILTTLGAEVITVNEPLDAVRIYKEHPEIDIVMLDVIMPGKSGVEIYDELRQINPGINVIFMSGYNKDNEVLGLIEKNPNAAFISKPYTVTGCQEKISKMLAKK